MVQAHFCDILFKSAITNINESAVRLIKYVNENPVDNPNNSEEINGEQRDERTATPTAITANRLFFPIKQATESRIKIHIIKIDSATLRIRAEATPPPPNPLKLYPPSIIL